MALAPEQFASLKKVLSKPSAKASAALGVPTRHIETFLRNLETMARRGQLVLGQRENPCRLPTKQNRRQNI